MSDAQGGGEQEGEKKKVAATASKKKKETNKKQKKFGKRVPPLTAAAAKRRTHGGRIHVWRIDAHPQAERVRAVLCRHPCPLDRAPRLLFISALRRPRGDCQEGRHLSCKTFLATPPSPRFGWVRSWHRCRCASIGVDHPPLSSRPDAGAPPSASITSPQHQGPMRAARQHRCSILVLWVFSVWYSFFTDAVVTRP